MVEVEQVMNIIPATTTSNKTGMDILQNREHKIPNSTFCSLLSPFMISSKVDIIRGQY
jgi:hypothetical protein